MTSDWSKYERFEAEFRALCRRHQVVVAPTVRGQIGVWDAGVRDDPVKGLVDRTDEGQHKPLEPLPDYFLTALAAERDPRYVGRSAERAEAVALAAKLPGAMVVPIGSPRHVGGWAVVRTFPRQGPEPLAAARSRRP